MTTNQMLYFPFSPLKLTIHHHQHHHQAIWQHVVKCSANQTSRRLIKLNPAEGKIARKPSKTEHHLWTKRDSAASGQKALNLVQIVCGLPNEKEVVYGALDKWTAWESEFPVIAVAKALNILKQRKQWKRVIQVAKWMFGKGQGMTMGSFDTLLLAFDMDQRVDEAQSFWNMILHTHERSISRRLFSRMISIYAHHNMPENIIEVFADMEELGVKPDEDTARKVARAFEKVGEKEKQKLVLKKYLSKWKYIHFKGERACLSILVTKLNCQADLAPAPLCANIFRACKKKVAMQWAIHGHFGFNFAANFIWNQRGAKKSEESDDEYKKRVDMLSLFPRIHDLMMVALRLDEANAKFSRKDETNKEPNLAIRSISHTCQLTESDVERMMSNVNPSIWEKSVATRFLDLIFNLQVTPWP